MINKGFRMALTGVAAVAVVMWLAWRSAPENRTARLREGCLGRVADARSEERRDGVFTYDDQRFFDGLKAECEKI